MTEKPLPRNILIGTALTPDSEYVVRAGVELAQRLEAMPILFHALGVPIAQPSVAVAADAVAQSEWRERLNTKTREALAEQAEKLGVLAAGGRFELVPGDPADSLVHWATTIESQMIVVGRGLAARRWHVLGSTADRLARRASCPVLVLHPTKPFPPTSMLVPVDLSTVSAGALRLGLDLAARLEVAPDKTEVLFVLQRAERAGSLHFSPEQVERFASEELQRFVAAHGGEHAPRFNRRLVLGQPRDGILEEVEKVNPGLLVLGTQSRRGLDRLLLGSVATAVLYGADTTVLVVPPKAAAQALEPNLKGPDWTYISDDQPQAESA